MPKTYHLKLTGGDTVDVPESDFRDIETAIYKKQDGMVKAGGVMFAPRDVRRVTSSWEDSRPAYYQEERPEVSEEHRQTNMRRMRWIRSYIFDKLGIRNHIPAEEREGYGKFVAWYESPGQIERRKLRKLFRQAFFDTYFKDHQEEEYCFESWLPFHDGNRDPREFVRADHTPQALGLREPNSLLNTAEALFGVKHTAAT